MQFFSFLLKKDQTDFNVKLNLSFNQHLVEGHQNPNF